MSESPPTLKPTSSGSFSIGASRAHAYTICNARQFENAPPRPRVLSQSTGRVPRTVPYLRPGALLAGAGRLHAGTVVGGRHLPAVPVEETKKRRRKRSKFECAAEHRAALLASSARRARRHQSACQVRGRQPSPQRTRVCRGTAYAAPASRAPCDALDLLLPSARVDGPTLTRLVCCCQAPSSRTAACDAPWPWWRSARNPLSKPKHSAHCRCHDSNLL